MLTALVEEYERAVVDYKKILKNISNEEFNLIRDKEATDPDCKSIQTVSFHIIQFGYTYANYIQSISTKGWLKYNKKIDLIDTAIEEVDKMMVYTKESFHENWYKTNKELEKYSFKTRWNVTYDLEQLLEHAIVHILRHRRQVENFLKKEI